MSYRKGLVNTDDGYRYYKAEGGNLSIQTFRKIVQYFVREMVATLLTGVFVALPAGLGTLGIMGRRYRVRFFERTGNYNIPIDWEQTKRLWEECEKCAEEGQKIYQLNEHTSGVVYKFLLNTVGGNYRFKNFYYFTPCRALKREMAKRIKSGQVYYVKN